MNVWKATKVIKENPPCPDALYVSDTCGYTKEQTTAGGESHPPYGEKPVFSKSFSDFNANRKGIQTVCVCMQPMVSDRLRKLSIWSQFQTGKYFQAF